MICDAFPFSTLRYARRFLVDDFNLLRPHRLNGRAASLLDPAAHLDIAACERFWCKSRARENTLVPLNKRDGKVFRPRRPKLTYTMPPFSRTDVTLPSTRA